MNTDSAGAAWLEQNGRGHVNGEQREVLAKALCLVKSEGSSAMASPVNAVNS